MAIYACMRVLAISHGRSSYLTLILLGLLGVYRLNMLCALAIASCSILSVIRQSEAFVLVPRPAVLSAHFRASTLKSHQQPASTVCHKGGRISRGAALSLQCSALDVLLQPQFEVGTQTGQDRTCSCV
jgi:hypothetical protein